MSGWRVGGPLIPGLQGSCETLYIYIYMPACCVAGVSFFLRALQPYTIWVLSWGPGPFFCHFWGSSLHVIFVAV